MFGLFHDHKYVPKEVRYPIALVTYVGNYMSGTAIHYECDCGESYVGEKPGRWEIWKGDVVQTFPDKVEKQE